MDADVLSCLNPNCCAAKQWAGCIQFATRHLGAHQTNYSNFKPILCSWWFPCIFHLATVGLFRLCLLVCLACCWKAVHFWCLPFLYQPSIENKINKLKRSFFCYVTKAAASFICCVLIKCKVDVFFWRKVFGGVGWKLAKAFYLNMKYLSL